MNVQFKSNSLIAKAVGDEIGEVESSYISDGIEYLSVIFYVYGAQVVARKDEFIIVE